VPGVPVLSPPGLPEPLESVHVLIPGPYAPSVQLKPVGTDWPTVYVPPEAGEAIAAVGAAATV
jgi:hypothetical protein